MIVGYSIPGLDFAAIDRVLGDVGAERLRQHVTFGQQNLPDGTAPTVMHLALVHFARAAYENASKAGCLTWLDILREEVEEVAAESDPAKLRAELVQVAAVAAAWVEAIDRRMIHPQGTEGKSDT